MNKHLCFVELILVSIFIWHNYLLNVFGALSICKLERNHRNGSCMDNFLPAAVLVTQKVHEIPNDNAKDKLQARKIHQTKTSIYHFKI